MINYVASLIDEFVRPPYNLLAKGLVISMVYFALTITIILTFVIIRREVLNRREKRNVKLRVQINKLIIEFLYAPDGEISSELELSLVKSVRIKQIIIDTIVELRNALSGEKHEKLKDLYTQAGLHEYSLMKLNSRFWPKRVKGIKELSAMDVEEAHEHIKKLVNQPNEYVSMEAKIALIRMNENNPLSFLGYTKTRLTGWEQISIYLNLKNSYKRLPNFSEWLYTENTSVTEFCLEMIQDFGQKFAQGDIIMLIEHPSPQVRENAYRALSVINPKLAGEILPANFEQETPTLQCKLIQLLAATGSQCSHFLLSLLKRRELSYLAFDIAKSLGSSTEGMEMLVAYSQSIQDDKLSRIVEHLNDSHIYDRL